MSVLKPFDKSIVILGAVGLMIGALFVALSLLGPSFVTFLNDKTTDLVMAGGGERPASGRVAIVDLDEKSLAKYGQWPWPRHRLAALLQQVCAHGARSIALDMILAEPDRTSPARAPETGRQVPGQATFGDHDRYLGEILVQGPFVLGYKFIFTPGQAAESNGLHPLKVVQVEEKDSSMTGRFFEARSVVGNLSSLAEAVSSSGFLNAAADPDGILRRMPLVIRYQGEIFPSLSLAALMRLKGISTVQLRAESAGGVLLLVGGKKIPLDHKGNVRIDFNARTETILRVSAFDLLEGVVPDGALADMIVLVGSTASGLDHEYQTPNKPVVSHVSVHAQMLETLLAERFPVRDERFVLWEGGASLLLGLLGTFLVLRTGVLAGGIASAVTMGGLWFGARMVFRTTGYLFSPLVPMAIIVSEYAALTIVKTRKGQHQAEETADQALMLLRHSEHDLNSIIGSIPDIIFRLDTAGKVIFVSPAITQYSSQPEELLGRPIFELVDPGDREKANHRINERRTGTRATHNLELRLLLANEYPGQEKEQRYFRVSAQGLYRDNASDRKTFLGTQGIAKGYHRAEEA